MLRRANLIYSKPLKTLRKPDTPQPATLCYYVLFRIWSNVFKANNKVREETKKP